MAITKEEFTTHQKAMAEVVKNINTKLEKVDDAVGDLKVEIASLPEKLFKEMDKRYASKESFLTVRNMVYGAAGGLITFAFGIIVGVVIYSLKNGWIS